MDSGKTPSAATASPFLAEFQHLQALMKAADLAPAREYARLTNFEPETEAEYLDIHAALQKLKLPAQAEIATAKFLTTAPESWNARLNLAKHLFDAKRFKEVKTEIDKIFAQPGFGRKFWHDFSELIWLMSNGQQLLQSSHLGLQEDATHLYLYISQGVGFHLEGQQDRAQKSWVYALSQPNVDLETVLQIIVVSDRFSYTALAERAFEQALNLLKTRDTVKTWLKIVAFLETKSRDRNRIDQVSEFLACATSVDKKVLLAAFNVAFIEARFQAALKIGTRIQNLNFGDPEFLRRFNSLQSATEKTGDTSSAWWEAATLKQFERK